MGRREEHALKQLLRITILLIGLIWILAWAAAGRFDDTPNTQDGSESPLPSGEIAAPGERDSAKTLRVQIQGEVQEMDMGTYLLGVLRAEMPASFEEEALKAQAIAARTYTLYRIRGGGSANHPDADACDDHTCCKAYINAEQAAANWGSMAVYYEEKLARAVSETDGEVILYDGAPILAVFFSSADGSTQGAGDVWMNDLPYLQKVDSPETEELVPNYYSVATFTAAEFKSLVLAAKPDADLSGSPEGWIRDIVRNAQQHIPQQHDSLAALAVVHRGIQGQCLYLPRHRLRPRCRHEPVRRKYPRQAGPFRRGNRAALFFEHHRRLL